MTAGQPSVAEPLNLHAPEHHCVRTGLLFACSCGWQSSPPPATDAKRADEYALHRVWVNEFLAGGRPKP